MSLPSKAFWLVVLTLSGAAALSACGDDDGAPGEVDAGADGGLDAGGTVDAGPACPESCGPGFRCCVDPEGVGECVDTRIDDRHCGGCNIACTENIGTGCEDGFCGCGLNTTGCIPGTVCCPPRPGSARHYCADFKTDRRDCGGCGEGCDPAQADRCDGGRCLCGDGRTSCEGTPEDRCCTDELGASSCVNTETDRRHCGACGTACDVGETCADGECTLL